MEDLRVQRWDDHRYYHHSRINQSLHLVSALSFLVAYVLMFKEPVWAALIGWGFAMTSRQIGHFFFEPKSFDQVNQVTHEYKERVKVGYNLQRKIVLMLIWLLASIVPLLDPTLFGTVPAPADWLGVIHQIGLMWLLTAVGGLAFRTVQLFVIRDVRTGLVWLAKILTDPFHDIKLYYKAPWHLMRGELIDPMAGSARV